MATILLSAAGAAIGSGFGGTVLGLSGAVIGRAVGATLGRSIDQKILGVGSDAVEVGRVDRFRLMGASEGTAIARVWGRVRIAGQVIWATRFQEHFTQSGGKGAPQPRTQNYYYSVSLAIALCEGEISRVGRIWADGNEIPPGSLDIRVYKGSEDQLPDPKMQAVEGFNAVPAYRGTAYVVIEDLDLSAYGNRVPQFSFEVVRPAQGNLAAAHPDLSKTIKGVCLIPGTGEYALATTPVHYNLGLGANRSANVNSASGKSDFTTSFEQLQEELPLCNSVSIVASWFGNDLRCANCLIEPKVEQIVNDGIGMPWKVSGVARAAASIVPSLEGRSVYGGSPTDRSIIEAIQAIHAGGKAITFYPFILMEQLAGNTRPNPWDPATEQPPLPWRGRITLDIAPGLPGSADQTAAAALQVNQFFGQAQITDFQAADGTIEYSGPPEWSYRRFILHYASLCALAGGVDAFCIGSEMRSLTQIRGAGDSFPSVAKLRELAADVRLILGPTTKIGYAADWSEYFGYHTGNNVYFHLDELWADPAIDFVGIDNYMPLSDWRDGENHADAKWGDIHNPEYLNSNVSGGQGFDWYYSSEENELNQVRTPIADMAYSEHWVFRYKDLKGWWENSHHNRINGVRSLASTAWTPESKPIRFTEYGCAAVDKGSNEPNKFVDVKSSESGLPNFSNGQRDDAIQVAYYRAMSDFWSDSRNNPISRIYNTTMLDFDNSLAWAWDARPFPDFPGNTTLWSDGENYQKGHWINGRSSNQSVASVISEICENAGVSEIRVNDVFGLVRGFSVNEIKSARAMVQPIMLGYGVEASENNWKIEFASRNGRNTVDLKVEHFAISSELNGYLESKRTADLEMPRKVRAIYTEAERDFGLQSVESTFPDSSSDFVSQSDLPLVLTRSEATSIVERWLSEVKASRDSVRFALPRSMIGLVPGDIVAIAGDRFRIDSVEALEFQIVDAVKINPNYFESREIPASDRAWNAYLAPLPVFHQFLDLPLLSDDAVAHAPHVAAVTIPWQGPVGVWSSASEDGFSLNTILSAPAVIGVTQNVLVAAQPGQWDRGLPLRVSIQGGTLSAASDLDVLLGSNLVAIGDGTSDRWEVFQFRNVTNLSNGIYELSGRLRGQLGTDSIAPMVWPVGSRVVFLNSSVVQINLAETSLGLGRFYRVSPISATENGEISASPAIEIFTGIGLRPYSVSHVKVRKNLSGNIDFSWIRRTRLGGDSWQSNEVPLAEESEQYLVRILDSNVVVREEIAAIPLWVYTQGMQTTDGILNQFRFEVSQISQSYGAGPSKFLIVDL